MPLGACIVVAGGNPLQGAVAIGGAKNSAVAAMAAAALAEEETVLENMPEDTDVDMMGRILAHLGCRVVRHHRRVRVSGRGLRARRPPDDLARRLRASFYMAGVLLARLGEAEVPLPGGCPLGSRPVDFHLEGFRRLGAQVDLVHGCVRARARRLAGTEIYINRASVGTTINLMLAASLAQGTTVLVNAAREPEVVDTAVLLSAMGGRIQGAGTDVIRIDGVRRLTGARHAIIPDRIEAGTFLAAAGLCGGEVRLL
ncbi:MAG TPA: UDP-N-acetylglucosamine 1-carboxyvinyltransferase, partial [Limnochordales bacterium]